MLFSKVASIRPGGTIGLRCRATPGEFGRTSHDLAEAGFEADYATSTMLDFHTVQCPFCGEPIELAVDGSAGAQAYIEDCQVCCCSMNVSVRPDEWGRGVEVEVGRDD